MSPFAFAFVLLCCIGVEFFLEPASCTSYLHYVVVSTMSIFPSTRSQVRDPANDSIMVARIGGELRVRRPSNRRGTAHFGFYRYSMQSKRANCSIDMVTGGPLAPAFAFSGYYAIRSMPPIFTVEAGGLLPEGWSFGAVGKVLFLTHIFRRGASMNGGPPCHWPHNLASLWGYSQYSRFGRQCSYSPSDLSWLLHLEGRVLPRLRSLGIPPLVP